MLQNGALTKLLLLLSGIARCFKKGKLTAAANGIAQCCEEEKLAILLPLLLPMGFDDVAR